jgi:hypothetical protein
MSDTAVQSSLGAIRSQSQSTGGCGCSGGGRRRKRHTGGCWSGGARTRRRSRSLRGGNYAPSTDGHPAQLPYAGASVAPATALGDNGTFSSSGGKITASPFKGGRRRRRGGSMVADAVLAGTVVTLAHYLSKKSKTKKGGRRYPRRHTQRSLV